MTSVPPLPRYLGLAGLLVQLACLYGVLADGMIARYIALAIGWAYAALILSFLGGIWWGVAASQIAKGRRVPGWLWVASVLPSLLALATYLPWLFGGPWPGPSLMVLGIALIASLWVDRRIAPSCPHWWMALRVPLSLGLGGLTILLGLLA